MIKQHLLDKLSVITEEEHSILNGQKSVDKSIYSDKNETIVRRKKLAKTGKLIDIRTHTRFIHFFKHTHDYIEAVYMCQGSTTHIVNGKKIVLKQGELLFLGQTASQEILPASKNDIAINFIIQPSFFDKTLELIEKEDSPIKNFILSSLLENENQGYLHFKVASILPVQNLVENLIYSLLDGSSKKSINETTMALLIMHLLGNADKLVCESKEDRAVFNVLAYIEENYKDGSLKEIANILHYDFYWLSREIKKQTGKTYTEHLQEKRLSKGAFLLKNTNLSVEEIAFIIGYENKSYFYRKFYEKFSVSPKKYRNN